MYSPEILASMKKVEAAREANIAYEPRRLTAEEKEALLNGVGIPYVRKVKKVSAQKAAEAAASRNRRQRNMSEHERRFKKQFLK